MASGGVCQRKLEPRKEGVYELASSPLKSSGSPALGKCAVFLMSLSGSAIVWSISRRCDAYKVHLVIELLLRKRLSAWFSNFVPFPASGLLSCGIPSQKFCSSARRAAGG